MVALEVQDINMIFHWLHNLRGHFKVTLNGKTYWWRDSGGEYHLLRFGIVGRVKRDRGNWSVFLTCLHPGAGYQPVMSLGSDPDLEKAMIILEDHIIETSTQQNRFATEFDYIRHKRQTSGERGHNGV